MISINEHNIDRIIRFVLAAVLLFWAMFQWPIALAQPWPLLAAVVAVVLVVTSVIGFCPLYKVVGMSTAKK
ncbi:MAG: DUF2892 domain-containing protein [Candidatus Zophobacter franzmannii]|nr:DUF2892 domain-containing protein [Candidatus Zophobacter franzmannii]